MMRVSKQNVKIDAPDSGQTGLDYLQDHANRVGLDLALSSDVKVMLEQNCSLSECAVDKTLFLQNQVADTLYFLLEGEAQFIRHTNGQNITFATINKDMVPIGVSGLNSPGRYMSTVQLVKGSRYIALPLQCLYDILIINHRSGALLMSYILSRATELLWATRSLTPKMPPTPQKPLDGVPFQSDRNIADRLGDSAFFAQFDQNRLPELLHFGDLQLFAANEVLIEEGQNCSDLIILFTGSLEASFSFLKAGQQQCKTRTIVRPGVALSWSNGQNDMVAPYRLKAKRDTTILRFSAKNIQKMIETEPLMASALFQRQIWQIGRFQQSSNSLLNFDSANQTDMLQTLLDYNGSKIPISSPLYSAVHMLDNRFTQTFAFDCIYEAMLKGNDAERTVASLVSDALKPVERKLRFFEQLKKIYTRVTSAEKGLNAATLRQLTQNDFDKAFEHVPYVIDGIENLPDTPTTIFIYNHLAAVPENSLANGHAFSIDSHFVSAKILYPKYADGGQRIVRASRNTEFWRNGYYARLDNIVVHTPESDRLVETETEKAARKHSLFVEAQRAFDAGRPIVIAPEGTSETDDNLTMTSPGPLKLGAFKLAASLSPSPLIVPIALANFDRSVSETTYAAVIKPAFKLKDVVDDITDDSQIEAFLLGYRKIFRGYVEDAIALAEALPVMPPEKRERLSTNMGLISPVEEEFGTDIRELEAKIEAKKSEDIDLLFYGSSTLRLWEDAKQDLGVDKLSNLAFGGATISACQVYATRLLSKAKTGKLVLYAGDNDLGLGMSVESVIRAYQTLIETIQEILPNFQFFVISIKPSPFRQHLETEIKAVNEWLHAFLSTRDNWHYVDIHTSMRDAYTENKNTFYADDPLHMNEVGYALLAKKLRQILL